MALDEGMEQEMEQQHGLDVPEQEMEQQDSDDKLQYFAATQIQAMHRGKRDRHRVHKMKAERTVCVSFVLEMMHYSKVSACKALRECVRMVLQEAIANEAGERVLPEQVELEFAALAPDTQEETARIPVTRFSMVPALKVDGKMEFANDLVADRVREALATSKGLSEAMAARVGRIPGVESAATGSIAVSTLNIFKPENSKPKDGTKADGTKAPSRREYKVGDPVKVRNEGYPNLLSGHVASIDPLTVKVDFLDTARPWAEVCLDHDALEREAQEEAARQKNLERISDALRLTQDGAPSYADLAKLTAQRNEMLSTLDDSGLYALMDITGASTNDETQKIIPTWHTSRSQKVASEMREVFLKFCRKRRGTSLRAWRLDIDKRGTNHVLYTDFKNAAIHLGLNLDESRLAWQAFRPPGNLAATTLEFGEFDPAEWDNLNGFLELLWKEFNFQIDLIWSCFDRSGDGNVDIDEWEIGANTMGFKGDSRLIFYGMDTAGRGSLWKEELQYLLILRPESHKHPEDSPLVLELKDWVTKNFDSPQAFCDSLGLRFGGEYLSIHSLARKLAFLGFKGDCLHTSMCLSRHNHIVKPSFLMEVLGGGSENQYESRPSVSYAGRHIAKAFQRGAIVSGKTSAWISESFDPSSVNEDIGKRERKVFSGPYPRPVRDEMEAELKEKLAKSPSARGKELGEKWSRSRKNMTSTVVSTTSEREVKAASKVSTLSSKSTKSDRKKFQKSISFQQSLKSFTSSLRD